MARGEVTLYTWCIENNRKQILDEWDYEKNKDFTPKTVSYGSARKAHWKCALGHTWEGEIKGRATKGRNCPICSNDKVLVGYNDFETWCHQHNADILLEEWDTKRNGDTTPQNIVFGYRKPVWWKCKEGHTFQKTIRFRMGLTGEVRTCPYCRNIRVVVGDKRFGVVAPHLVEEWDYQKNENPPDDYSYGSMEKVWWKCKKCGNQWQATVASRVNGTGCPPCSYKEGGRKQRVPKPGRSLLDIVPEVCQEWHPTKNGDLKPSDVNAGTNRKVWWLCSICGNEWECSPSNRKNGNGCPACMDKQRRKTFIRGVIEAQGSLADNYPNLVAEWDYERNVGLDPTFLSSGSEEKIWWKCSTCGHAWQTTIVKRTKRNQGCPECRKELKVSYPEKAIFFYIKQLFGDAVENYRVEWLGKHELDIYIPSLHLGIEYDGSVFHRNVERDIAKNKLCYNQGILLIRVREPKCPTLPGATSVDFNLSTDKEHDLAAGIEQVLSWIESKFSLSFNSNVDLSRDRGQIYELMNLQVKENSLQALFPELAKEWHPTKNAPLTPDKILSKSNRKVWWLCSYCGREWEATINSRSNMGTGCTCQALEKQTSRLVSTMVKKHGSLLDNNPALAAEWHPTKNKNLRPSDLTASSNKKVWWLSPACGHEWDAKVNARNKGVGCPVCKGLRVLEGFNDFASCCPELMKEWHHTKNMDIDPTKITKGTHKKAWWVCSVCGYEWEADIGNRSKGIGCPECAKLKRVKTRWNK